MSNVHELKTDPEVFDAVWRGDKTHEIRLNDRDYRVGDSVFLRETRYTGQEMSGPEPRPLVYTGRTETRVVSHVLEGYGLQPGWAILSFAPTQGADARPVASTDWVNEALMLAKAFAAEQYEDREQFDGQDNNGMVTRAMDKLASFLLATRDAAPSDAPIEFPYQRTFDAIAAATWMVGTSHIHISVLKFREAYNAASTPEKTS